MRMPAATAPRNVVKWRRKPEAEKDPWTAGPLAVGIESRQRYSPGQRSTMGSGSGRPTHPVNGSRQPKQSRGTVSDLSPSSELKDTSDLTAVRVNGYAKGALVDLLLSFVLRSLSICPSSLRSQARRNRKERTSTRPRRARRARRDSNQGPGTEDQSAMADPIKYDDFAKLELRVAKVLEARPHPNADKLLLLQIDMGDHQKQIVAGIRQHYAPEQLVGKLIVVVNNLEPAMLRGETSNGMLLAATSEEKVILLTVDDPTCVVGAKIK